MRDPIAWVRAYAADHGAEPARCTSRAVRPERTWQSGQYPPARPPCGYPDGLCLGVLQMVGGGPGGVGTAGGCGPDHGAGVWLLECPPGCLLAPVVAPAQGPDVAFAAAAACLVGDRVVEVAPCRGAAAAGGAAVHGAGRDQMPQSRAERVTRFLVAVITGSRGQRRDLTPSRWMNILAWELRAGDGDTGPGAVFPGRCRGPGGPPLLPGGPPLLPGPAPSGPPREPSPPGPPPLRGVPLPPGPPPLPGGPSPPGAAPPGAVTAAWGAVTAAWGAVTAAWGAVTPPGGLLPPPVRGCYRCPAGCYRCPAGCCYCPEGCYRCPEVCRRCWADRCRYQGRMRGPGAGRARIRARSPDRPGSRRSRTTGSPDAARRRGSGPGSRPRRPARTRRPHRAYRRARGLPPGERSR